MLLIWSSEAGVQVKGLCLTNGSESSVCLSCWCQVEMSFRRVRVRMSLHPLLSVCLWFALCKREVTRDGKVKWKLGCLELVHLKCQSLSHNLMETSRAGGASRKCFLSWLCSEPLGNSD